MTNLKRTLALCCTFAVCISGLMGCKKNTSSSSEQKKATSATTVTTTKKAVAAAVYNGFSVPELSCDKITFMNEYTLFLNADKKYVLLNSEQMAVESCTLQDDDGNKITINCKDGKLSFLKNKKEIDEFMFNTHCVEYKGGYLLWDKSRVKYTDRTFWKYDFTDKISLVRKASGEYEVQKSGKKVENASDASFVDTDNDTLTIEIDSDAIYFVNQRDEICPVFVINDDVFVVTGNRIFVNGKELLRKGANDLTAKTTTTATAPPPETDSNGETKQTTTTTTKKTTTTTTTTKVIVPEVTTTEIPVSDIPSDMKNKDISEETTQMIGYVNELRKQYKLSSLSGLKVLDTAAAIRADELVKDYSHKRGEDKNFDTVLDDNSIMWWHCAENIDKVESTSVDIRTEFENIMKTEEGRAVILNPKMKYLSLAKSEGKSDGKDVVFWELLVFSDVYVP